MRIAVLVGLLSSCASAHAFVTGAQLAELCGLVSGPGTSAAACVFYIRGAEDRAGWELALRNFRDAQPRPDDPPIMQEFRRKLLMLYCPPDDVSPQQTMAVVSKHLRDNPAKWHMPAAQLLVDGLQDAFPC